jgi:hypothetical protein
MPHALLASRPFLTFESTGTALFLSATFDTAARVAHVVYFGGEPEDAGWRRGRWTKQLAAAAPQLAAVVADATPGAAI